MSHINVNVWIVVLNWNGWEDTISCLKSLRRVEDPPYRILVVDNASTDESLEKLREFQRSPDVPQFEILEAGANLGFAGGNNRGIEKAIAEGAQWILILNNDTTVDSSFLKTLLAAAETDSHIGILNPKILLAEEPNRFWFIGGKLNWMLTKGTHKSYAKEDRGQYDTPKIQDTDYATGGCLLVRREVIESIGLLPEEYFVYYEDAEWSLRARKGGWRCVVVPKAKIWHKGAASSKENSPTYIRYHVRNGLLLVRRNGNPVQIGLAYAISLLRALWQLPKFLHGSEKRMWAGAVLSAIRDAWLGTTGPI